MNKKKKNKRKKQEDSNRNNNRKNAPKTNKYSNSLQQVLSNKNSKLFEHFQFGKLQRNLQKMHNGYTYEKPTRPLDLTIPSFGFSTPQQSSYSTSANFTEGYLYPKPNVIFEYTPKTTKTLASLPTLPANVYTTATTSASVTPKKFQHLYTPSNKSTYSYPTTFTKSAPETHQPTRSSKVTNFYDSTEAVKFEVPTKSTPQKTQYIYTQPAKVPERTTYSYPTPAVKFEYPTKQTPQSPSPSYPQPTKSPQKTTYSYATPTVKYELPTKSTPQKTQYTYLQPTNPPKPPEGTNNKYVSTKIPGYSYPESEKKFEAPTKPPKNYYSPPPANKVYEHSASKLAQPTPVGYHYPEPEKAFTYPSSNKDVSSGYSYPKPELPFNF
uniref:Uncharacterized protein n=1 Tax=Glossina pallidipes TaxID=7398 RepID=A0A1A9ZS05_GLOPL